MEGVNKENEKKKFYGIYIPVEDQRVSGDKCCVVDNLKDVTGIFKRNPHARFKPADSEEEAWFLAQEPGADTTATTESPNAGVSSNKKPTGRRGRLSLSELDSIRPALKEEPKRLVGEEKDTRFPTPKIQELTAMAREIAAKNLEAIITRVKANPKVLISDCDTPQHLQVACRYNALHLAAKSDAYEIIAYILNTVSSNSYMTLLYPNDAKDTINNRVKYVVDAYLNTPDKMAHETPLHFAVKFMCVEATKVLVSHPWCKIDAKNTYQEAPINIIGSRVDKQSPDFEIKKQQILNELESMYIVPIWRDISCISQPTVGEVVSFRELGNRLPSLLMKDFPDFDVSLLGPCSNNLIPRESSFLASEHAYEEEDPTWKIKGFCGPTTKNKALELFDHLKLTSGHSYFYPGSPAHAPVVSNSKIATGFRNTNEIAVEPNSTEPPKTPPSKTGLRTPPTSPFLFSPLAQRFHMGSPISPRPTDIIVRRRDAEKGLERTARKFACQAEVMWSEEWKFLNFYGDILSEEGLKTLEEHLSKVEMTGVTKNAGQLDCTSEKRMSDLLEAGDASYRSPIIIDDELSQSISSSDDDDSWDSTNHSDTSLEYFDCSDETIFVNGNRPSKYDYQLYAVIKENENIVSFDKFPLIFQWLNTLKVRGQVCCERLVGLFEELRIH